MTTLVAGLDLGSTGVKILVADENGHELAIRQLPTPWTGGPGGTTSLHATDLLETVQHLVREVADLLPDVTGDPGARVGAVAVSGMGETGFVVDERGDAVGPGFAWFDPRGAEQVAALPEHLRAEFAGRTGLPWGVQVSAAKIAYLRDTGVDLTGARWANLPEFVVAALGGTLAGELSLMSRTGLLDQATGRPWPELLDHLGVTEAFLPELVDAGTPLGTAAVADWLPPAFAGAALTVAGHDHLVSAVSGGAIPGDRYHVSMGTAEVLLRVVDSPLDFDARRRLGDALINCVRHVVPGQYVLVAGVKTGLLMRRALQLFGIEDAEARTRLDDAVADLDGSAVAEGGIVVRGARNDDGVLSLTISADGVTPAEAFRAVLEHGNDEIALLIEAMDREVPPARSTLLTGGWARMRSVLQTRSRVLPAVTVSERSQDTAYGAALFASRLLTLERAEPLT